MSLLIRAIQIRWDRLKSYVNNYEVGKKESKNYFEKNNCWLMIMNIVWVKWKQFIAIENDKRINWMKNYENLKFNPMYFQWNSFEFLFSSFHSDWSTWTRRLSSKTWSINYQTKHRPWRKRSSLSDEDLPRHSLLSFRHI